MNWLIPFAFCAAYAALGWYARGPLASSWWRGQCTIAEACIVVLEGELEQAQERTAIGREVYLKRLDRCGRCATCNPEPNFADLPDYELGAPE